MSENIREIAVFTLTGAIVGWLLSWVSGLLVWDIFNGILGAYAGNYLLTSLKINLGVKNPIYDLIARAALGALVVIVLSLLIGRITSYMLCT